MSEKKILFVVFGTRELINNFKQNQQQYPSDKNSIELNNHKDLEKQIEYIHTDSELSHKDYIILHVYRYDVKVLEDIIDEVKGVDYLNVKFLVLNDENTKDEKMQDIQELVHAINQFKGKIGKTKKFKKSNNKPVKIDDEEKKLNELMSSNDTILNLDSINYLIDVTRNFDNNKQDMDDELRNSILSSLLMISIKLESDNEKLLENKEDE